MNPMSSEKPLFPIFLKIPPESIVRLKFILESYEYLGVLRTLDKEKGVIAILSVPDAAGDLESILSSLAAELRFHRLHVSDLESLGIFPPGKGPTGTDPDLDWSDCDWLVD